jgi:citrate synthase
MLEKTNLVTTITTNDAIDESLYSKYNVKRGLRNADGTGVLVGLTRIGDVHGYIVDEGEKVPIDGKLYYRGVSVEEIIAACEREHRYGYEETVFLLMLGYLPSASELERFNAIIASYRPLPPGFAEDSIIKMPSPDIMNKLACSVLNLYSCDDNPEDLSPGNVLRQCLMLIARFPAIIAYCYMAKKHYIDGKSLIIHQTDENASAAELLLSLIRPNKQFSKLEAEVLDRALILHAEHGGGNNSSFAVHLVSSTGTDTYSAIAAGVESLKGPKHGGANAKVMQMMGELEANVHDWKDEAEVAAYIEKILKGEAGDKSGLFYGFGHAVYTLSDPRARILREKAGELAAIKGMEDEYALYRLIENIAPAIVTRVKGGKDACANVDFYSGFVYKMLDIPSDLYTAIFAMSRVAGWAAHRMEEVISGGKIIRPAYKCVQPREGYVPLAERGA